MGEVAKPSDQPLISRSNELVYLFVASQGADHPTLRQVQNAMKFSSPSSAVFHLQKLEEAGFVGRDEYGNYHIKGMMPSPYVSKFLYIRKKVFPKRVVFALVTTGVALGFSLTLSTFILNEIVILSLAPNLFASAVFWYEAWDDWKIRPRF